MNPFRAMTWVVLALPLGFGLAATIASAFGVMTPGLEGADGGWGAPSLEPWSRALATPGLARSTWLSLSVGLLSTTIAVGLAVMVVASWHGTRALSLARRWLPPTLAVPHAAFAIGLAFLIAPSGWLARLISPWLTGWVHPPDVATVGDPGGFALTLALVCKEFPFLSLALIAAAGSGNGIDHRLRAARVMGYGPVTAWLKVALPVLYPLIRLPVLVVLTFGVATAEPAIILGPSAPPTLTVVVLRANADPDLGLQSVAAALALVQLVSVAGAMAVWIVLERAVAVLARPWPVDGRRGGDGAAARLFSGTAVLAIAIALVGAILSLAVWSVADGWRWPDPLPSRWSDAAFVAALPDLTAAIGTTLALAIVVVAVALALVIGGLEAERGIRGGRAGTGFPLIMLPLMVPQPAFLVGAQVGSLMLGGDGVGFAGGGFVPVAWAHLLHVLPYVHLVLAEPWRAFDPRLERQGRALGAGRTRFLLRVKLPMLVRPILIAAAVGFAVGIGQYLPTLFAGGGRIVTLTTEAVALASGGDRRVTAAYGLAQALLPAIGFALALGIPAWAFRNRKGMASS